MVIIDSTSPASLSSAGCHGWDRIPAMVVALEAISYLYCYEVWAATIVFLAELSLA